MKIVALGIGVAMGVGAPGRAAAQSSPSSSPSPSSVADLVAAGAAAAARGDHEACVKAYAAALAIEPAHTTAGELGLCEEALGRHVDAYDHLLHAREGEVPGAPPPAPAQWKRYHEAFQRVGQRIVRVLVIAQPNAAEVFVDGRSVGSFVSGRYFAVTPGQHTWTAKLAGYEGAAAIQIGRGGDLPDVALELKPLARGGGASWRTGGGAASCPSCPRGRVEEPCVAARGVLMTEEMCDLFEDIYRERMDPTLLLIGGGILSFGLTADVAPGFFVGGSAVWGRKSEMGFHLGFEVQALMPTKVWTRTDDEFLDAAFVTLAVVPCVRFKWLLGCGFVDAGLGISSGPPRVRPVEGGLIPVVRLGPRLALDVPFADRFGVRFFGDVRFSPIPSEDLGFDVSGVPVWDHPTVSGLAGVGLFFQ